MHSTEPETARPEGVEAKVFSTFKMAGSRGNLRTVVTPEDVVLELNNGNYLRLSHNKVEGMRHHQFHIIPHWCGAIAMLMIYSSIRILTGQMQIWIGLIGAGIIISWLGFRKSALTIDSGEAGTYTLFGKDTDLIKFRVIADRVRDGIPFEKAIEGVDEVIMSEYPSSSIFEELVETIETEISENKDALSMAMADLIEKSKNENEMNQDSLIESEFIEIEEQTIHGPRIPLQHGSITRARRIQNDIRPAHSGWKNVANRTEILRPEPHESISLNEDPHSMSFQPSEESFNMFGFDLDESEPKEEPFNMFGESFESSIDTRVHFEPSAPRSSYSMMPEPGAIHTQNHHESMESTTPFINSFQQTGSTTPLNQLGATLEMYGEDSEKTANHPQLPGIVSQAKGDVEETRDADLIPIVNTDSLKRIRIKGAKNLRRLTPNELPAKRLTLWSMLTTSLKSKTPNFLRNRASKVNKKSLHDTNEISLDRTMDALKIQAHHTHEAQLAEALKMMPKNDENLVHHFLEEISPDLVEQKIPSSFQELKASNDEQNNVLSKTGITRLD